MVDFTRDQCSSSAECCIYKDECSSVAGCCNLQQICVVVVRVAAGRVRCRSGQLRLGRVR